MNSDADVIAAAQGKGVARRMIDLLSNSLRVRSVLLLMAIAFTAAVGTGFFVPNWNWSALEAIGTTAAVMVALWTSAGSNRSLRERVRSARAIAAIIHDPLLKHLQSLVEHLDPESSHPAWHIAVRHSCNAVVADLNEIAVQIPWIKDDFRSMDRETIASFIRLQSEQRGIRKEVGSILFDCRHPDLYSSEQRAFAMMLVDSRMSVIKRMISNINPASAF